MIRCSWIAVLGSVLFSLSTADAQSSAPRIKMIELSPAWSGSAGTTQAIVTIVNDKGVFKRAWNPSTISAEYNSIRIVPSSPDHPIDLEVHEQQPALSHDTVSTDDVWALVRALTAPAMRSPSLSNLGITPAWLAEHASDAAKHFGTLGESNGARQQEFFRRSFTDLSLIGRIIPRVVGGSWTDDPVWVHVMVRFTNGRTLFAETTNQPVFMLPWNCRADGKTTRTYNADISRAVAKLLPDSAVNRERLQGSGLVEQIVFQMGGAIKQQWQQIGAEDKAGDALARLRQKYIIRRSEVSEHIGLHFGPSRSTPGPETVQADVRLTSSPSNLVVATVFPLDDGRAIGLDTFLQEGDRYERIVLDNPWIMASLKHHGELGAWLVFVKDASMSDKAMQIFLADMHALGHDDLGQEVAAHRNEVADLSYFGNELILFPDHHAIVWRWDPKRDLFEWPASAIQTDRCTDYQTLYQGCSSALVGSDGHLQQ